ncbi:hypothetical protein LMG6001_05838 [Achromobacter insolitus]|nr:hypothetical protein LMG6001_05838 [Achromobacter insolitus]
MAAAVQAGDEDHPDGSGGRHVDGIVARAAGQAHAGVAQLAGGGLHRVHHQRRAVGGPGAAQLREACGQAQRRQVRGHARHQGFGESIEHGVAVAAHFQGEFDAARHRIGGVGRHGQAAHRRHDVVRIAAGGAGLAVGGVDDAGRAHQGVAADVHGCGAGMVGLPLHRDLHAADADDVGDHADGQAAAFQHRALFDMQLDEGGSAAGAAQWRAQR